MKTSESLWQCYRDKPALNDAGPLGNFPGNSFSFKDKQKITGKTGDYGTKIVETMISLKHLHNFWRTLEIPLINCEN